MENCGVAALLFCIALCGGGALTETEWFIKKASTELQLRAFFLSTETLTILSRFRIVTHTPNPLSLKGKGATWVVGFAHRLLGLRPKPCMRSFIYSRNYAQTDRLCFARLLLYYSLSRLPPRSVLLPYGNVCHRQTAPFQERLLFY